jgi:steroid 5-alpha reductase family enzyme
MNVIQKKIHNFLQFVHMIRRQTYIEKISEKFFDVYKVFSLHTNLLNLTDTLTPLYLNLVIQSIFWVYSLFKQDITQVDSLWGLSFIFQAVIYFFKSFQPEKETNLSLINHFKIFFSLKNFSIEKLTFTTLLIVHSLRLTAYIIFRRKNNLEDNRYAWMRAKLGKHFIWFSLFFICIPMALANYIIGLVIYAFNRENLRDVKINQPLYWNGILMMIAGSLFQSIADQQMYNFKASPKNKGKILDSGLWALCRHPNYFGDTIFWWGAYVCNVSVGVFWTIISPLILTISIIFITGIPLLESFMVQDYGELYKDYQHRVSAFIPNLFNIKGAKGGKDLRKVSNNISNTYKPNTCNFGRNTKVKNGNKSTKNKNRKCRKIEKQMSPHINNSEFYKTLQ